METFYQMMKMMLAFVFSLEQLFAPKIAGGDFAPSEPVEPGDETKYVQIGMVDEGFDIFQPVGIKEYGGYRYGPTMILNTDGSWRYQRIHALARLYEQPCRARDTINEDRRY